jgi:hypothetical protein
MPGLGLRHWQEESAACGQKKNASMRPPACATARCSVSWIEISVAASTARARSLTGWWRRR